MNASYHPLAELFAQLGLPSEAGKIDEFLGRHSPLPESVRLAEAPFWTPAQAALLREELLEDADWALVVDQLNLALRKRH